MTVKNGSKRFWIAFGGTVVAVIAVVSLFYARIDERVSEQVAAYPIEEQVAKCPKVTALETNQQNMKEAVADLASTQKTLAGVTADLVANQEHIKDVIKDWAGTNAKIARLEESSKNMKGQLNQIQATLNELLKELRNR
jgi:septal ring factor EnvC (AmiA/AmiB activator)